MQPIYYTFSESDSEESREFDGDGPLGFIQHNATYFGKLSRESIDLENQVFGRQDTAEDLNLSKGQETNEVYERTEAIDCEPKLKGKQPKGREETWAVVLGFFGGEMPGWLTFGGALWKAPFCPLQVCSFCPLAFLATLQGWLAMHMGSNQCLLCRLPLRLPPCCPSCNMWRSQMLVPGFPTPWSSASSAPSHYPAKLASTHAFLFHSRLSHLHYNNPRCPGTNHPAALGISLSGTSSILSRDGVLVVLHGKLEV